MTKTMLDCAVDDHLKSLIRAEGALLVNAFVDAATQHVAINSRDIYSFVFKVPGSRSSQLWNAAYKLRASLDGEELERLIGLRIWTGDAELIITGVKKGEEYAPF